MNSRFTRASGWLAVAGCALWAGGCARAAKEAAPAKDFVLRDLFGNEVTLAGYRGRVVLLNFWAVGCGPCAAEAPHLRDLQRTYGGADFQVVAINAWNEESRAQIADFSIRTGLNYTILPMGNAVARDYGCTGVPCTFLIDRAGRIIRRHEGYQPGDEQLFADWIRVALSEKVSG